MSGKFTVSELYYRTAGRQDFGCSGFEIAARSRVCDLYRRCRHGREHLSECGGGIGARLAHIAFGVDFRRKLSMTLRLMSFSSAVVNFVEPRSFSFQVSITSYDTRLCRFVDFDCFRRQYDHYGVTLHPCGGAVEVKGYEAAESGAGKNMAGSDVGFYGHVFNKFDCA